MRIVFTISHIPLIQTMGYVADSLLRFAVENLEAPKCGGDFTAESLEILRQKGR